MFWKPQRPRILRIREFKLLESADGWEIQCGFDIFGVWPAAEVVDKTIELIKEKEADSVV